MVSIPDLGIALCAIVIIVVLIIFFLLWFMFKFIIAFFPSIVVALIVYLITESWILALVSFVVTALIFAAMGDRRRRQRY